MRLGQPASFAVLAVLGLLPALAACSGELSATPVAGDVTAGTPSEAPSGGQQNGGTGNPSDPSDPSDPTAPPAFSPNAAALYSQHCASCHGDRGQGTPFGLPLTRDMGLAALTLKIDQQMPQGNPSACTGECAAQLAQYVQTQFVEGGGTTVTCNDAPPGTRQLRLLTRREYRNTVQDLLGIEPPDVSSLPVEPRVAGFDNNAMASVVTSRHADGYVSLAETLARAALQKRPDLLGCDDSSCRDSAIRDFGKRAFRRPLIDAEVQRYQALFEPSLTENTFAVGTELLITAMLNSPHFLYRSELGQAGADGNYLLTPYETASALSYLFWGTMPDAALMAAADADALSTPAELKAHAERLLSDARASEQLSIFATQWLRTDGVLGANKDAELYPGYTDAVRTAQMAEQTRLFQELFLDSPGTFPELFLTQHTFVNSPLAAFYGLPDPGTGEALAKVEVTPDSGRGGILALGAVLAAHAHQNESSPIKRGLFVRGRILCQDLPAPPANLDTTPPGLDPTLTTRERFGTHTSASACASCHRFIDGVGFGFEGFDGVGSKRTVENGLPIDESGSVLGLEGLAVQSTDPFNGVQELSQLLANSSTAQRCLATQYFRFASGREGLSQDYCSIETLADTFEQDDLELSRLLVATTQLNAFTHRQEQTP